MPPREPFAHEVRITLGDGSAIVAWPEIDITQDMLSPGSPFTLSLWRSSSPDADAAWKSIKRRLRAEETVNVYIDGALQLRGAIQTLETNTDHDGGQIFTIGGRDIAARALDWDADPTIALRNVTLEDLLARLFQDVGLTPVITEAAAAREIQSTPRRAHRTSRRARRQGVLAQAKVQAGERIWQVGDKFARQQGCMMWTAPTADPFTVALVVDKPLDTGTPAYRFERRARGDGYVGNMLRSRYGFDSTNVPTLVTGFTKSRETAGTDEMSRVATINEVLRQHPRVFSEGIVKPRYITGARARDERSLAREVDKVLAEANAHLEVYEATQRGFSNNGKLLAINSLARVLDESEIPVIDSEWLITRVHFHQSRGRGQVAEVRMVPKGSIRVFPVEA